MFCVSDYYHMYCTILFMYTPNLFLVTKKCKFDVIFLCDN
ncbi:Uncharacterised protein [Klebsiella pneumoniae]|nr:hypothetical protein AN2346V1_3170 [Klebsiella pneumoniae]CAH6128678.1 hypothetical protein AN2346V1_3170 [Klebsiella pneumoniae]SBY87814.1 Uncharacterised protein [Klebsiella pneumoniae]SXB55078.1 Uncharacterised protein [Klebsiella pneumoniae]VAP42765.1 Uncharacterised protein [Klebsiella pneumoniae]